CHLVLGPPPPARTDRSPQNSGDRNLDLVPWVLSARSEEALRMQASALHFFVSSRPGLRARDVGLSLATTRTVFEHRAVIFASGGDAVRELESVPPTSIPAEGAQAKPVPGFPGQGGPWEGMARDLLDGDGPLA